MQASSMSQYYSRDVPLKAGAMADTGPITSVIILTSSTSGTPTVPATYNIVNVDLNKNAGGKYIYLAYSRSSAHGDPITGLQVFSDRVSSFPAQNGFIRIPNDLAEGAGPRYIYLYYTKNKENDPIHHVDVVAGSSHHVYVYPPDDTWVRINQGINELAGGDYIYICYKEKL